MHSIVIYSLLYYPTPVGRHKECGRRAGGIRISNGLLSLANGKGCDDVFPTPSNGHYKTRETRNLDKRD